MDEAGGEEDWLDWPRTHRPPSSGMPPPPYELPNDRLHTSVAADKQGMAARIAASKAKVVSAAWGCDLVTRRCSYTTTCCACTPAPVATLLDALITVISDDGSSGVVGLEGQFCAERCNLIM